MYTLSRFPGPLRPFLLVLLVLVAFTVAAPTKINDRSAVERFFLTDCRAGDNYAWNLSTVAYYQTNAGEIEGDAPAAIGNLGRLVAWSSQPLNVSMSNGDFFSINITNDTTTLGALAGQGDDQERE
jgi:hypothetical protein